MCLRVGLSDFLWLDPLWASSMLGCVSLITSGMFSVIISPDIPLPPYLQSCWDSHSTYADSGAGAHGPLCLCSRFFSSFSLCPSAWTISVLFSSLPILPSAFCSLPGIFHCYYCTCQFLNFFFFLCVLSLYWFHFVHNLFSWLTSSVLWASFRLVFVYWIWHQVFFKDSICLSFLFLCFIFF